MSDTRTKARSDVIATAQDWGAYFLHPKEKYPKTLAQREADFNAALDRLIEIVEAQAIADTCGSRTCRHAQRLAAATAAIEAEGGREGVESEA